MSQSSEEHIQYQEQQEGSIMAEPSQMSQPQYEYILSLIDTCILADVQKDRIHEALELPITSDHANKIINELLQLQQNPLDRIKNGELLLMSDVKQAVRKATEDPRT